MTLSYCYDKENEQLDRWDYLCIILSVIVALRTLVGPRSGKGDFWDFLSVCACLFGIFNTLRKLEIKKGLENS